MRGGNYYYVCVGITDELKFDTAASIYSGVGRFIMGRILYQMKTPKC